MLKNLRIIDQIIPRSRPPAPIETRSLPALAHRYPRDFTFYVAAPVSSIETRSRPRLLAVTRHGFTFYVANPIRSIRERVVETVESCAAWICA